MKKRLIIVTILTAFCIVGFFGGSAMAAAKWWTCDVIGTGDDTSGNVFAKLQASGQPERVFTVPTGQENRYLAILLTAVSGGLQVNAYVDYAIGNSQIEDLRLLAP